MGRAFTSPSIRSFGGQGREEFRGQGGGGGGGGGGGWGGGWKRKQVVFGAILLGIDYNKPRLDTRTAIGHSENKNSVQLNHSLCLSMNFFKISFYFHLKNGSF